MARQRFCSIIISGLLSIGGSMAAASQSPVVAPPSVAPPGTIPPGTAPPGTASPGAAPPGRAEAMKTAAPSAVSAGGSGPYDTSIPQPLTVDQAVSIGLARNPQITAGAAGVASSAATFHSLEAFPALNLAVTRVTGSSAAPTLNGTTSDTFVDLGDVVDTSGQRRFQAAGARAQFRAAGYQLEETRFSLAQQIRDAYWSLVAARAQTRIGLESLQEVQHVNQLTRLQQTAGASPLVDVVRSNIDVANAQQAYITAEGAEKVALTGLNVLLARPPAAPVTLADSFSEDLGEEPRSAATTQAIMGAELPPLDDLIRVAYTRRPAVQAAAAQVQASDYALKQAKAGRIPDLSVDYERSVNDPVQSVLLGVHMPLIDFGGIRNSIVAAEQSKKQAQAQEEQATQQVGQQVAQAYADYTQARALAVSYRPDILTPSVSLLSMAQLGYRQGATGILPVIDAETTLRNARTGYINSILALYKAQDEMRAALGGPIAGDEKPMQEFKKEPNR